MADTLIKPLSDQPQSSDAAQDPNECLEIMHAPSLASTKSSSSSSHCPREFEFDPYHDKPISTHITKSRSVVHQYGLWHNSVHIWIVSPSSSSCSDEEQSKLWTSTSSPAEILLQKRSSTKDTFPNRYDISCAGHVSSCMTCHTHQNTNVNSCCCCYYYGHDKYSLLDTLRAELFEELGWIDGIHVDVALELSKPAFIVPAQQSHLGGCNAFEHVYFLLRERRRDTSLDADDNENGNMTTDDTEQNTYHGHSTTVLRSVGEFSLGSAEVSEILWRPLHEVLDALRSGDESYSPRTKEYVYAMEKELGRILFGGGVSS